MVYGARWKWALGIVSAVACSLLAGCTHDVAKRSPNEVDGNGREPIASSSAVARTITAASVAALGSSPLDTRESALATFDYRTLRGLEAAGFGFASLAFGIPPTNAEPVDNGTLSTNAGYASITQVLSKDLDELVTTDRNAGVGMKFAHRAFDKRWLTSSKFHFELVAVVHRVDRRVFREQTCGELRFVYRLAYHSEIKGQPVASRVPMTVSVVRWINDPDCRRWVAAMGRVNEHQAARQWTADGAPLSAGLFALTGPKSVEVNLQSVRWPSTVRPNMAGHAEYLLRVFDRLQPAGPFNVAALENTPDVDRLARDQTLRRKLSTWLRAPEQQNAIALGTVRVPDEFLAIRATSVAPHGLARKANRPFSALLANDWDAEPDAVNVLRRLDGLSCPGCHQSRSVAGFHILGNERADKQWDTLALPHSPHFAEDVTRRRSYVQALSQGQAPDEHRPPAERPEGAGGWGSRCGLNTEPGDPFDEWTCASGFACRAVDDPLVGECLPLVSAIGEACESGVTNWNAPTRDSTRLAAVRSCGEGRVCERNAVGFPGGMCSAGCDVVMGEGAVCGGIAVLDSFNACLARGERFESCLATTTRPGALRECSHETPCRDDYVCAATPSGQGACLPPYFLFQLRVDGHVY